MKCYDLSNDDKTINALKMLANGVIAIKVGEPGPASLNASRCYLQLSDGRWTDVQTTGEDLEYMFEVFPVYASIVDAPNDDGKITLDLTAPVMVDVLVTESWLEPSQPFPGMLGRGPSYAQFIGRAENIPDTATAKCRYIGGVELTGANGETLTIASGSDIYTVHISGFNEDPGFNRECYVSIEDEAAR